MESTFQQTKSTHFFIMQLIKLKELLGKTFFHHTTQHCNDERCGVHQTQKTSGQNLMG
jgi:hypothetical protein